MSFDEDVFIPVKGGEAVLDLMNCAGNNGKLTNRFILLKNGQESQGFAEKAEELGNMVSSMQKLGTKAYQIDLTDKESKDALVEYL